MAQINIPTFRISKKMVAMVLGVALTAFAPALDLTEEQQLTIAGIIATYVLGQGVADHGKEAERAKRENL